ncbi:NAD(P)H-binding protein [Spirosoma spitsbergense]|uniref:NAD(P)H-binding protein n=1 Tax=Spirosoma spitsbergense TaxID=431554 RepID=UPI00036241FF|nr:NAD(P)H-binding protein [Spirosoma spitsbergense]
MNYLITGSLGHTSKPIVEGLIKAGNRVTVITSNPTNAEAIEALGAKAAVGSVEDADFLTEAFAEADAAYLIIPPKGNVSGWRAFQNQIIDNYIAALEANDIRFAVLLSSVGADLGQGVGPVDGLYDAEQKLANVPGLNSKFLRPSYFMYNLFGMIGMIKNMGIMGSNFGADTLVLTHTDDIAEVALHELLTLGFTGHQVRYIASDERTGAEIAQVLGEAIGKPETPWIVFSDAQSLEGMKGVGMSEEMAVSYTTMGKSIREGTMQADFFKNKPAYGNTKLEDFAKNEFAPAFGAQG